MNQENKRNIDELVRIGGDNITGIIVWKDGVKCYEDYYHGFAAADAVHMFSVTKSIFSALIGIAIDKGYISSADQKVLDFFPDYVITGGRDGIRDVTIKHLLTMTASYIYETEPYAEFFSSENWVKKALDLLAGVKPSGESMYSPIIGAHILGGVLSAATKRTVLDFAMEHLFIPLGIDPVGQVVFHSAEEQMAYYEKGRHQRSWVADPQGINTASWGLALTPADMAAIGQLYLDDGIREGRRILSSDWIEMSLRKHAVWNDLSYGYLWWVIDEEEQIYAAIGDGGNVIYLNRKKKMVITIAALFKPDVFDRVDLIREHLEPLFEAE